MLDASIKHAWITFIDCLLPHILWFRQLLAVSLATFGMYNTFVYFSYIDVAIYYIFILFKDQNMEFGEIQIKI